MEGYDVVTNDDEKVGQVAAVSGDHLVVEHGTIRKHRNALPLELARVDDDAHVVRATVSKEVLTDSPEVNDDDVDEGAVAAYYGLASGLEAPSTEGYGEVLPDETARSAEEDAQRCGVGSGPEERVRVRESQDPEFGPRERGPRGE